MDKTNLVETITDSYESGGKVLICGNGGLAAESEHFAAELVGKYAFDVYVPCFALTTNTSLITAISNDIGFEDVFAHQVKTLGKEGDIFIGMTTSRSPNILKALETANERGLITVVVCGIKSGSIEADFKVEMLGEDTATIQEHAIQFLHKLAYSIKEMVNGRCRIGESK